MKVVLFLIFSTNLIFSYTYLSNNFPGDILRGVTAKQSSMGGIVGACLKDEPSLYYNPASIVFSQRQFNISLNYSPVEEKLIVEGLPTIYNFQTYYITSGYLVFTLIPNSLVIGFAKIPLYDLQYKHENREYLAGEIKRFEKIETVGGIESYTFSIGTKIRDFILFGISFNNIYYKTEFSSYTYTYGEKIGSNDNIFNQLYRKNTVSFNASIVLQASDVTRFSFCYVPETEFEKNLKLAAEYIFSTVLNFDSIETLLVSDLIFTDGKNNPELHIGVEHFLSFGSSPVRYGVSYVPHKVDKNSFSLSISFGTGWNFNNIFIDLSCVYENINIDLLEINNRYIQQNTYKIVCSTKFLF